METLHQVLRTLRGESKARPSHLAVFREFLDHLERIGRRSGRKSTPSKAKPNSKRGAKR